MQRNMTLKYSNRPGGAGIILSEPVISTLLKYQQLTPSDKEAGGQLFGKFDGCDTFIVEATEPKVLDKRSRYGFKPNRFLQRLEISKKRREGLHFVGDWHSHPEKRPSHSGIDLQSMIDCYHQSRHELHNFLMIIIGTDKPPEGLLVCLVNDRSHQELILETG